MEERAREEYSGYGNGLVAVEVNHGLVFSASQLVQFVIALIEQFASHTPAATQWKRVRERRRPSLSAASVMMSTRAPFMSISRLSVSRVVDLPLCEPLEVSPGDIIEVQLPSASTNPTQETGLFEF